MKNKSLLLLLAAFTLMLAMPVQAQATQPDQVPSLSWERGKQQTVVLGTVLGKNEWEIHLERNGLIVQKFNKSRPTAAGYVIYYLDLPQSLQLGNYTVKAVSQNASRLVAYVDIVSLRTFDLINIPTELTNFLLFLSALLIALVILHLREPKKFTFYSHILLRERFLDGEYVPRADRAQFSISRLEIFRIKFIQALPEGVVKNFLRMDWNFSTPGFNFLINVFTLFGLMLSLFLSIMLASSDFYFAKFNFGFVILLSALSILSIFDFFVAFFFLAIFLLATLTIHDTFNMSNLVLVISFSFIFITPSIIARLLLVLFRQANRLVIYVGSLLPVMWTTHTLLSIVRSIKGSPESYLGIESSLILSQAIGLWMFIYLSLKSESGHQQDIEIREFTFGTLISRSLIVSVFIYLSSLYFIWTENLYSIFGALVSVCTLLLMRIRFSFKFMSLKAPLLSYLIVWGAIFFILTGVLIGNLKSYAFSFYEGQLWYLILSPFPALLFSLYSSLVNHGVREEIST